MGCSGQHLNRHRYSLYIASESTGECLFFTCVSFCLVPGNIVALLHAFFSNLPQEWLDGTHLIIKNLRPVTSVAMLRVVFRIMGPLLPRIANTHALFNKVTLMAPTHTNWSYFELLCNVLFTLNVISMAG